MSWQLEDLGSLKRNFSLSGQLALFPRTNSLSVHGAWCESNTRMASVGHPTAAGAVTQWGMRNTGCLLPGRGQLLAQGLRKG